MNIIKAKPIELVEAFYLLKTHLLEMNSRDWLYWNLTFDLLRKEIENGTVFLYKPGFLSLGLIIFSTEPSEEYKCLHWNSDSKKPLFVRYLIDHPLWRKLGIANHLLMFAEEFAKDQGFTSVRLDAYGINLETISLFTNANYQNAGQIQIPSQKIPFLCFEKKL
jgi:GNAT superfamily N-acetyltransferase